MREYPEGPWFDCGKYHVKRVGGPGEDFRMFRVDLFGRPTTPPGPILQDPDKRPE